MGTHGLITLTTDFGLQDPFVGVMKGVILGQFPEARVVDLTHGILPHWPQEAGFWVARVAPYFPAGTVHVAVVDPGVGTSRRLLIVESRAQIFLAPDNGLLGELLDGDPQVRVHELHSDRQPQLFQHRVSATFHGRDLFAPVAAALASGQLQPSDLGVPTEDWIPGWTDAPQLDHNRVNGVVVTIDHFGNLFTNIPGDLVRRMADPHVHIAGHVMPLRRTYGEVKPGEDLALINSFDVLEIATAQGRAADKLGLERGAPVVVQDSVRFR